MFANPIELLQSFLSNNTVIQKEAENNLSQLAKNDPNASIDLYISALDDQNSNIGELAAVSIKQYHLQNHKDYELIQKEKLNILEKKIFYLLSRGDRSLKIYKRLIELVVLFYANDNETYSYLVQSVLSMENTENSKIKISIMYFMEILCENCFNEEHLKGAANEILQLFERHIRDSDITVGIAAVKATISFLSNIEDKEFIKKFSEILPVLLQTLITAVKQDEDSGVAIIQTLGDLVEAHPGFIKPIIEDLLYTLSEILNEKSFSDAIRNQAINCIEILSVSCDVALRKSENFKKLVVPALIRVLCEISKIELNEWLEDIEGQIISKNDPYFIVQDSIAKLSDALKPKFLLPQFIPYITECMQSNEWYMKYAGYIAIGVLAEGCSTTFHDEMDHIMQLILAGFEHQDPRVIYAAATAVALLCNEYSPDLQKKYNKQILQNIIKMLNSDQCLKLQLKGAKIIVNFCEGLEEEEEQNKIVTPFANELLAAVHKLFQKAINLNSDIVLYDALNAVSILSSVLDLEFAKYAQEFLPGLKHLLETIPNTDEKNTNIRVGAIECIGFITTSLRTQEGFIQEVDQIMEYFMALQKKLDKGDLEIASILDVYAQISSHMFENFVKYMPHIYQSILEAVDITIQLETNKDTEKMTELEKKKFVLTGKLDTNLLTLDHFVFDTSAFAIKLAGCNTVFSLSRNLKKEFYPYINYSMPIISKYFDFKIKDVAIKALKTVKNFLLDCRTEPEIAEVIMGCLPNMIKAIKTYILKEEVDKVHYVLKQISKNVDFLKQPLINDNLLVDLVNGMSQTLTFCDEEKKKIIAESKELEDYDEEKKEQIEKKFEEVNNLMHIVMEISGKLLNLYKENVEGLIGNGIAPYYYNFLINAQNSVSKSEILYSICLFDDILEFGSLPMFEKVATVAAEKFIDFCKKPGSVDILQSAVFGLGVISSRMNRETFNKIKIPVVEMIHSIVTANNAFSEEKACATENAIGALGKIALHQSDKTKTSEEILIRFLQFLPLKEDFEEAQLTHKMLLKEILNKNEALFSASQDVQNALIQAISNISKFDEKEPGLEILDEEGRKLMAQVLSNM